MGAVRGRRMVEKKLNFASLHFLRGYSSLMAHCVCVCACVLSVPFHPFPVSDFLIPRSVPRGSQERGASST